MTTVDLYVKLEIINDSIEAVEYHNVNSNTVIDSSFIKLENVRCDARKKGLMETDIKRKLVELGLATVKTIAIDGEEVVIGKYKATDKLKELLI